MDSFPTEVHDHPHGITIPAHDAAWPTSLAHIVQTVEREPSDSPHAMYSSWISLAGSRLA